MPRQLLIDKWSGAQEVHLSTALDLNLSDSTVYRLGRLVITSVRLHDVGLVGGKEPVAVTSEAQSDTEASSICAELVSLGLPTAFGKKGGAAQYRREGKRTQVGSAHSICVASKEPCDRQPRPRNDSSGGAHGGHVATAAKGRNDTPWLRGFDDRWGCHYYYNTQTEESTWEAPAVGFVPWEEATGPSQAADSAQQAAAEPGGRGAEQQHQQQPQLLRPDWVAGEADDSTPAGTETGSSRVASMPGRSAAAAAPLPKGEADSRAPPRPAPRMLTEEDLLRAMGLWQDNGRDVEADGSGGGDGTRATASAVPPAAWTATAAGAGGGATSEPPGDGPGTFAEPVAGGGGGGSSGPGLLRNLLLGASPSSRQLSSSATPTPRTAQQQRVVPPTALSEEQLLARLSLDASTQLPPPMPPPPPAPAPPPPAPPSPLPQADAPPSFDDASGIPAAAGLPGHAAVAKPSTPRMLTEEDILRSMGLLPGNPTEPTRPDNEGRSSNNSADTPQRPAGAAAQASSAGPRPPPGFGATQRLLMPQGDGGSPKGGDYTAPLHLATPAQPPILTDDSLKPQPALPQLLQLQGAPHPVDQALPYHVMQPPPQHQHQGLYQPPATHCFGPGARPPLPPGFHPPGQPIGQGRSSSAEHHGPGHHTHGYHHPHGAAHELRPPRTAPFHHVDVAGVPYAGAETLPPPAPPGFGHPSPFPPPAPVDMWAPPRGPFGPPLMPGVPPRRPPPPGFGLSPIAAPVPGMPYGPTPYPYEGHPYAPYGTPPPCEMSPYAVPPGFAHAGHPPMPSPQPFEADGHPASPMTPASIGGPERDLPPTFHHRHHHHHHAAHPPIPVSHPPLHLNLPQHHYHNGRQQAQQLSSPPPTPVASEGLGQELPGAPKEGSIAAGPEPNRRAVTWTLKELERQLEVMAASASVSEGQPEHGITARTPASAAAQHESRVATDAGNEGSKGQKSSLGSAEGGSQQRHKAKGRTQQLLPHQHQRHHEGRHPGAADGHHTGARSFSGGGAGAADADKDDDDSAFYDIFTGGTAANVAAAAAAARTAAAGPAARQQRMAPVAKPPVGEDDGTRRIMLDPSTAAYVRTLLPRSAAKYWMQRYSLFSRFDNFVQLDTEGWWSVTPEVLAAHQASRSRELCARGLVAMDACCGCGGNVIQMAGVFPVVIGVEISPKRVEMARHNSSVYDVAHKCQFLCADFFKVAPGLKVDALFMSPPWGGPKYQHVNTFDVFYPLVGFNKSLLRLLDVTLDCVREQDGVVAAFLPRNTDLVQLAAVVPEHAVWEVERAYVNNKLKGITLYCHPGRTPDQPNVRLEADAEYMAQGAHMESSAG